MTNPTPHGQVPAIQRYSIGYHSDEWGVRSLSPTGIYDDAGPWVRYEDHVAALLAQQPTPSAAAAVGDDLRDRLVAISAAIADQDDRAAQAMLREILAAPQPSPHAPGRQPAPEYVGNGMFKGETIEKAAEHWANWCDRRCMTGLSEFLRVVAARAPAGSVPAVDYPPLPTRRRTFLCYKCGGRECEPGTIGESHPPCKCGYLGFAEDLDFTEDQMRDFADRTHALRMQAAPKAAPPAFWHVMSKEHGEAFLHTAEGAEHSRQKGHTVTALYTVPAPPTSTEVVGHG